MKTQVRERSSITSAALGDGGLSQNADTADAGGVEGGGDRNYCCTIFEINFKQMNFFLIHALIPSKTDSIS